MASAADMLTASISAQPRRPTTVNSTRALWRRGIELAPTAWGSPPPRMSWRQAFLLAGVQLLALLCLMRYLGFYPWVRPLWPVLALAALLSAPYLTGRVGEMQLRARAVAWWHDDIKAHAAALEAAAEAARERGQRLTTAGRLHAAYRAYLRAGAYAQHADRLRQHTRGG